MTRNVLITAQTEKAICVGANTWIARSEIVEMIDVYTQLAQLLKPVQLQAAMTEALQRARTGHGLDQPEFDAESA